MKRLGVLALLVACCGCHPVATVVDSDDHPPIKQISERIVDYGVFEIEHDGSAYIIVKTYDGVAICPKVTK